MLAHREMKPEILTAVSDPRDLASERRYFHNRSFVDKLKVAQKTFLLFGASYFRNNFKSIGTL